MDDVNKIKNSRDRCSSRETDDQKLLETKDEPDRPSELLQTGVAESIICANMIYHLRDKKLAKDFCSMCNFFKGVEWNNLLDQEWEEILKKATVIHRNHRQRMSARQAENK